MNHLALEIFDRDGTGSRYAWLDDDASITIIDTSEIFASGDVWSYSFTLNIPANLHIFGTSGDLHGSRLHEQINKRRARLWVDGLPLIFGYLKLDHEAEVDADGNVDVGLESGQKTFDDLIDGVKATEVSVGDVEIGIALNRKRVVNTPYIFKYKVRLDGLKAYAAKYDRLKGLDGCDFEVDEDIINFSTPYAQQFPKLVKSHGIVYDGSMTPIAYDKTNIQTPYDGTPQHSFCNVNVCYQLKAEDKEGNEVAGRGYTMRLARGQETTDGGDGETRYNNAPNFYLLHFVDRLFHDMGIRISENQAKDVEDLCRVFMLNYGCHYEEIERDDLDTWNHTTPSGKLWRYNQYYLPVIGNLFYNWECAGKAIRQEDNVLGKVLLRNATVEINEEDVLSIGSIEGVVTECETGSEFSLQTNENEIKNGVYSAYTAYATGDNYPDVEISEIINAMKSMFGIRLLFYNDYKTVRIVLLRNIFRSTEVQDIDCEILDGDEKVENSVRGFRMTYGKGTDDTSFYYKGFNDLLPHKNEIWKDTTDKHDYTQFEINAEYDKIKNEASANNKVCYVTPVNGNAYCVKVDEDEDVLFPSLFEVGTFMDAEDGDCTGEDETIEEVQCGASPAIMNDVNGTYASLFTGDLKAPTRSLPAGYSYEANPEDPGLGQKIATYSRVASDMTVSMSKLLTTEEFGVFHVEAGHFLVNGTMDLYLSEGFQIRMEDNYAISNGDTPFDSAGTGLVFGIMRGSGKDAQILYAPDTIEDEESMNDYWEVQPGSGAIDDSDSCDKYGNPWSYHGEKKVVINTAEDAIDELYQLFPNSNAAFNKEGYAGGYITDASITTRIPDDTGKEHNYLIVTRYGSYYVDFGQDYIPSWVGKSVAEVLAMDLAGKRIIVEVDSRNERKDTLLEISHIAQFGGKKEITIDNGVDLLYGRFSLKLRAEKPNPYYEEGSTDPQKKNHYLAITNENMRGRGLSDKFYKEYSKWEREARIVRRPVRMELAQLLRIDKTKRVRVGDITGFIRKMQYSVSNKTGLGEVMMEIMYI